MNKSLSKYIVRRRISVTQLVQQLWDAVKVIKCQHQTPTLKKIARYMSRTHSVSEEEVTRQLQNCVRDGLLHLLKNKTSKGSKHGADQEVYKLPEPSEAKKMEKETHDWYCFTCHAYGDVILCTKCYRVYHCSCLPEGSASDKYVCDVCKRCEEDNSLADLKLRKLNRLLSFITKHLQDKYIQLNNSNEFLRRPIFISSHGAQMDISTTKESWRVPFLVYKPFDLTTMKAYATAQKYNNVAEFIAHAQLIVHAVVIFHGDLSRIADTSRQMLRECISKVEEMQVCPSCYERAVLKQTKNWFCKPCRPPHELVFAGSPYMPAKVLQDKDEKRLVVFFGLEHNRITVDRDVTLPIDTPIRNLGGKTNQSWSRAMDELSRYQKLLDADLPLSSSDEEENKASIEASRVALKEKERIPTMKESPSPAPKSPTVKLEKLSTGKDDSKNEVKTEVKRRPGRPSKRPIYSSDEDDEITKEEEPVKRRRGRPPKNNTVTAPVEVKRRGRPRRQKVEEEKEEEEADEEEDEEEEDEEEEEKVEEKEVEDVASPVLAGEIKPEERRAESPTTTVSTAPTIKKNEEEIVSSSCMEPQVRCVSTQTSNNKKDKANKEALTKLKEELDEVRASHAEELKSLKEAHAQEIAATKKKQWCYNCEQEAIYHCCWNTAYCSTECQQVHWQREHKRVCRRKR